MSVITMPVSEAKQRFSEIVKDVEQYYDRYFVTKNGKETAVLMSVEEYESLLETLDILAHKKELRAILNASAEVKAGKTISLDHYLNQKRKPRSRGSGR